MNREMPTPGVSREQRISDAGLDRLQQHLQNGTSMSKAVLQQWIRRYGEPARQLLRQYDRYTPECEP